MWALQIESERIEIAEEINRILDPSLKGVYEQALRTFLDARVMCEVLKDKEVLLETELRGVLQ